ncbi:MAG: hypothetical protein JRJ68_04020 [Deltaproteobacteria bacterium]|nr:hypothetical protein [Deltaproteobacteria bacterium]
MKMFSKLFSTKKRKQEKTAGSAALSHGIDPEMNYCPLCGDEYRVAGKRCAACDVELISGAEKLAQVQKVKQLVAGRSMELTADDELVNLRKGMLNDMKQLQSLLAGERIPAVLVSDDSSCGKGCCGTEMYLQVRKNDTEPALAVLAKDFMETTSLSSHDLTHVDAVFVQEAESNVCPACGCQFSSKGQMNCPECGLCFG